jgi:hypothetical protein
MATQSKHPWRAVARTVFAAVVSLAAMAPLVYQAATQHDPAQAGGWSAVALAISAGITRVLAVPAVNVFLQRFLPFLAAEPADPAE